MSEAEIDIHAATVDEVEREVHRVARREMVRIDVDGESDAPEATGGRGVVREHHSLREGGMGAPETSDDKERPDSLAHLVCPAAA